MFKKMDDGQLALGWRSPWQVDVIEPQTCDGLPPRDAETSLVQRSMQAVAPEEPSPYAYSSLMSWIRDAVADDTFADLAQKPDVLWFDVDRAATKVSPFFLEEP